MFEYPVNDREDLVRSATRLSITGVALAYVVSLYWFEFVNPVRMAVYRAITCYPCSGWRDFGVVVLTTIVAAIAFAWLATLAFPFLRWTSTRTWNGEMVSRYLTLVRKRVDRASRTYTWTLHLEALDRFLYDLRRIPKGQRGAHVLQDIRVGLLEVIERLENTPGRHHVLVTTAVFSPALMARFGFTPIGRRTWYSQLFADIVAWPAMTIMRALSGGRRRGLETVRYERIIEGA